MPSRKTENKAKFIFEARTISLFYVYSKWPCQFEQFYFPFTGVLLYIIIDIFSFLNQTNTEKQFTLSMFCLEISLARSTSPLGFLLIFHDSLVAYFINYLILYSLSPFLSCSNNFFPFLEAWKYSQGASIFYQSHCPKMYDIGFKIFCNSNNTTSL